MKNTIIKKNHPGTVTSMISEQRGIGEFLISNLIHGLSRAGHLSGYLFVLLIVFTAGCSTVFVPLPDAKVAIERGDGDCKDKAIAYQAALQDQGIESCITCGVLSLSSQPLLHCWNEVLSPEDGKWKLVDVDALADQQDGWDVEQSPEYLPYIKYSGKVTVEDIRQEKGYSWKSEKNLSYLMENCQFNWMPVISELDYLL